MMKQKIFKDSFWIFGIEIFLKIKAVLLIPFLTRFLGTIDYGIWSQINIIISSIYPIILLGTETAIYRFLPGKNVDEQKKSFTTWIMFLFLMSFSGAFFFYYSAEFWVKFYFGYYSNDLFKLLNLAVLNIIITVLINAIKSWYRIQNDFRIFSIVVFCQSILNLIAVIYALSFEKSLYYIVFYSLIADMIIVGIFLVKIVRFNEWYFEFAICKKFIKYGYVLIPSGYATWILNSSDRIFLAQYSSLEDVGIYSLAYSLGYLAIQLFVNPIYTVFPTKASFMFNNGDIVGILKLEGYSKRFILLSVSASILFFLFSGKDLIKLISTEAFVSGYLIIPVITLGYLFHMLASYELIKLGLLNKQKYDSISTVLACIVNLFLNFILIPKYGMVGAAGATFFAYLIQFLIARHFYYQNWNVEIEESYADVYYAFIISMIVLYIVNRMVIINNNLIINFNIIVFIYSYFLWKLKAHCEF